MKIINSGDLYILTSAGEPVHAAWTLHDAMAPLRIGDTQVVAWADPTRINRHWIIEVSSHAEFHVWRLPRPA